MSGGLRGLNTPLDAHAPACSSAGARPHFHRPHAGHSGRQQASQSPARQPEHCSLCQRGTLLQTRAASAAVASPPASQPSAEALQAATRLLEGAGAASQNLLLVSGREVTVKAPQGAEAGQVSCTSGSEPCQPAQLQAVTAA